MTNPDPQLLSLAHESVWRGQARRKLAEDIAAELTSMGSQLRRDVNNLDKTAVTDRIEKHLSGAML